MTRYLIESTEHHVVILSRDEAKQADMLQGYSDQERIRMFIGDVRDLQRLYRAFDGVDVVLHAAALKRIEVGHYNPTEMVKTNVLGTMNVIEAAQDCGVKKVVGLSTDKAFQPVSAYGNTKATMESLLLAANNTRGKDGPIYAVTRYGNVAGSNGSIIPKWRKLIAEGKPLSVTDPTCTRFYMTTVEAVDLVWRTVETMNGGELVIPDLPAYAVGDLGVAMAGEDWPVTVTGLDPWEKKHEGMDFEHSSDKARRMSVSELREALDHV